MPSLTRRKLLTAGVVVAVPSISGCSFVTDNDTTAETDLLRLGSIEYANLDQSSHALELVVSVDGEVKYWNTLELASVDTADSEHTNGTLDVTLPTDPVEYTVIARVNQTETAQTSSSAGIQWSTESITDTESPCATVRIRITESADVEVENYEAKQPLCKT